METESRRHAAANAPRREAYENLPGPYSMIHFTCDCCGREINHSSETRYVVRLEVYAAVEDDAALLADESDHLEEIEDLLERMDELDDEEDDENLYRQVRYDLCPGCRERFLRNPLGRGVSRTGYSDN